MLKLSQLRGRVKDEDEGTWFISLADLLTLLLCFFVLMLAVSQVDQERYRKVAGSLEEALKAEKARGAAQRKPTSPAQEPSAIGQLYPVLAPALPPQVYESRPIQQGEAPQGQPQPTPGGKSMEDIRTELGQRFAQDPSGVQVEKLESGFAITLKGAVLFDRASAELNGASLPYLDSIASSLRASPYKVTVEGHTDNAPIQSLLYPSNWELSAARASRVARYLLDRGVAKERIHIAGYADTRPVAPNAAPDGQPLPDNQARNRRVVILVNP